MKTSTYRNCASAAALALATVLAQPALAQTPAARTKTILRMDGILLLGFGPRTPEAARSLHALIYDRPGGAG